MTRSQRSTPSGSMPPDLEERTFTEDRGGTVIGKVGTEADRAPTTAKPDRSDKLELSERVAGKRRRLDDAGPYPTETVSRTVTTRTTPAYDEDMDVYPEGSTRPSTGRGHDTFRDDRFVEYDDDVQYDDVRSERARRSEELPETYPETSRMVDDEPIITPVGVMPDRVRASAGQPAPPAASTRTGEPLVPEPERGGHHGGHVSAGALVSDVAADLSLLVRKEVELAKAEMRQSASRAGRGAGAFGGAAVAGLFATFFLLLAVMFGLHAVMALGWAALIVGCVLALCAAGLGLFGLSAVRRARPLPHQTVETLKEDMQWAHGLRK